MDDNVKMKGSLLIQLFDRNGILKEIRKVNNLVVNAGLNYLSTAILSSTSSPFTHMAIGTGTAGPSATDTTLGTEIAREVFTSASTTTNVTTLSTTYAAGVGTGAITEAGVFNAASAGTMLSRVVFGVVNKAASDTIAITWTITVG